MKDYTFVVTVKWTQMGIEAKNIEEAKDKLKEIFYDEFNLKLRNGEIKKI